MDGPRHERTALLDPSFLVYLYSKRKPADLTMPPRDTWIPQVPGKGQKGQKRFQGSGSWCRARFQGACNNSGRGDNLLQVYHRGRMQLGKLQVQARVQSLLWSEPQLRGMLEAQASRHGWEALTRNRWWCGASRG